MKMDDDHQIYAVNYVKYFHVFAVLICLLLLLYATFHFHTWMITLYIYYSNICSANNHGYQIYTVIINQYNTIILNQWS